MDYYLREIKRSFVDFVLLKIEGDPYTDIPTTGESHKSLAIAYSYKTLINTIWRKGDGTTLSGGEFEARHLGECNLITSREARKILFESDKEFEYKALKSFIER